MNPSDTYHVNIKINEVTFALKETHNFKWLTEYGSVFKVFDQQDSGNLSFGVKQGDKKLFVKYAGAKPIHYEGEPSYAVARLKQAAPIYRDLKHKSLITLLDQFQVGEGYALVFEWVDGECLHPHWSFPPPEKYTNPNSPYYQFKQLPLEKQLESLNAVFSFHEFVEKQNYVAIDFYDGSILYNFAENKTIICDIDYFQKKPFTNHMGQMWGSKRFMSPEEFELGASIDSKTNVFNLGAMAFSLLGGELDRSFEKWQANPALYEVALKAVEQERDMRFATVEKFYEEWKQAEGRDG